MIYPALTMHPSTVSVQHFIMEAWDNCLYDVTTEHLDLFEDAELIALFIAVFTLLLTLLGHMIDE